MRWVKIGNIQKWFDDTRKEFFPRWDKKQEWKIRISKYDELDLINLTTGRIEKCLGACKHQSKTILIRSLESEG